MIEEKKQKKNKKKTERIQYWIVERSVVFLYDYNGSVQGFLEGGGDVNNDQDG